MAGAIIGASVIVLVLVVFLIYQRLPRTRNNLDAAWIGVEERLEERRRLVSELLDLVRERLPDAPDAFRRLFDQDTGAGGVTQVGKLESAVSGQLKSLLQTVRSQPDVADEYRLRDVIRRLGNAETHIREAADAYNETVRVYNRMIKSFPYSTVVGRLNYEREQTFSMEYATA